MKEKKEAELKYLVLDLSARVYFYCSVMPRSECQEDIYHPMKAWGCEIKQRINMTQSEQSPLKKLVDNIENV